MKKINKILLLSLCVFSMISVFSMDKPRTDKGIDTVNNIKSEIWENFCSYDKFFLEALNKFKLLDKFNIKEDSCEIKELRKEFRIAAEKEMNCLFDDLGNMEQSGLLGLIIISLTYKNFLETAAENIVSEFIFNNESVGDCVDISSSLRPNPVRM